MPTVGPRRVNPSEYFIKIVAATSRAIAKNNHSQHITAAFWYERKKGKRGHIHKPPSVWSYRYSHAFRLTEGKQRRKLEPKEP